MLVELIQSLEKEEVRSIKLFLNRTNASKNRKDIMLFDYIRKSDEPDEVKITEKLYDGNKNSYYRLKNRLLEDINKTLLALYGDANELGHSLQYMILSKHFFRKDRFDLALKYLKRAEKIAKDSNQLEILDMVYSDYIRLSHETLNVNPKTYIDKRSALREEIRKVREIDNILAILIFRIKSSQNYSKRNFEIIKLLQDTIDEYASDPDIKNNPVLKLKIYDSISRILLQQQDYVSLEKYLEETYTSFENDSMFKRSNHETKLQMLVYWSNSLFKNSKYQESLKVAELLRDSMEQYDKYLKRKYQFFYLNIQMINYSSIDAEKALEIADEALQNEDVGKNSMYRCFILLNKASFLFDMTRYKEGNRCLVNLKLEEAYSKLDAGFKLKISIAEIIFRYQLQNYDTVEMLIKNVKRDYSEILGEESYSRQLKILEIISLMMITHNIKASKELSSLIHDLIDRSSDDVGYENDVINYNTWLRSIIK